MFTDMTFATTESERHRYELLADAAVFRLARLARRAARQRTARSTAAAPVEPRPPEPTGTPTPAAVEADRRYVVSR